MKEKPKEKKWEPNVPTRVGRKKRKGPSAAGKLPNGQTFFILISNHILYSLSKHKM